MVTDNVKSYLVKSNRNEIPHQKLISAYSSLLPPANHDYVTFPFRETERDLSERFRRLDLEFMITMLINRIKPFSTVCGPLNLMSRAGPSRLRPAGLAWAAYYYYQWYWLPGGQAPLLQHWASATCA